MEDWVVDRALFRAAIRTFQAVTSQLRRLFEDSPSTGITPEPEAIAGRHTPDQSEGRAPTRSPSNPSNSSNNLGGFSNLSTGQITRATSAEEAIYIHLIGPNMPPNEDQSWRDIGFSQ